MTLSSVNTKLPAIPRPAELFHVSLPLYMLTLACSASFPFSLSYPSRQFRCHLFCEAFSDLNSLLNYAHIGLLTCLLQH